MKFCSPEGRTLPLSIGFAARPKSLEGLRIGLLDNTKAPVDKMMQHITKRLREKHPGIEIFSTSKKVASLPAAPEIMQGLRLNCDIVINALGD